MATERTPLHTAYEHNLLHLKHKEERDRKKHIALAVLVLIIVLFLLARWSDNTKITATTSNANPQANPTGEVVGSSTTPANSAAIGLLSLHKIDTIQKNNTQETAE